MKPGAQRLLAQLKMVRSQVEQLSQLIPAD